MAVIMAVWTLFVIYGTRLTYNYWTNRGMEEMVAVYYNRKIVHMLAAGVVLLIMPFVFTDPLIPLIGGSWRIYRFCSQSGRQMYWMESGNERFLICLRRFLFTYCGYFLTIIVSGTPFSFHGIW